MAQQNSQKIVSDSGSTLFEVIADTGMDGISITNAGIWHSSALCQQYIDALTEMKNW